MDLAASPGRPHVGAYDPLLKPICEPAPGNTSEAQDLLSRERRRRKVHERTIASRSAG